MKEKRKKNPAAVALGRLGGLKGGRARARKLPAKRRAEISRNAAVALNRSLSKEKRSANARKAVLARWRQAKRPNVKRDR